jgi:hypothetical protein
LDVTYYVKNKDKNFTFLSVEIFHYKNNPSKCICTNIEKIKDFQYYMHIIWNEPVESDNLEKGRKTF